MDDLNEVVLFGTICSIDQNFKRTTNEMQKRTTIKLVVKKQHAAGNTNNRDYPILDDPNGLVEGYEINDRVMVIAHTNDRAYTDTSGNRKFVQDYIIDTIEHQHRALTYAFPDYYFSEGGGFPSDKNEVRLVGRVTRIHRFENNFHQVGIMTNGSYVTFGCFGRQADYLESLSEGDRIAVVGAIQTRSTRVGQGFVERQGIIARDLCRIE